MGSFDFEGREVPFEEGDTVASALYRAGVRTFTRSFKYHRRRGLYCLTGDCPNCMVAVDDDPAVRSCVCAARDGLKVEREDGTPSADFDLMAVMDRLHVLTPVGFYYKTFIRPRWAWEFAERIIRRATGLGRLPVDRKPAQKKSRFLHADVLVIGAGVAGLSAARAAASRGENVVVCDEGRLGEKVASPVAAARINELAAGVSFPILERYSAIGVYEGPLVPLVGEGELVQVRAERVIVATGAVESHGVFEGNDVPGVWLGRGATRMAGSHGVKPASRAVIVGLSNEAEEQVATLRKSGVEIVAVLRDERIVRTIGRKSLRGVMVETAGKKRRISCDALIVSAGFAPRDTLLRMGNGLPVMGAGQVVWPSCSLEEAEASGTRAGEGHDESLHAGDDPAMGSSGYVCLCEDVSVGDLEKSWEEGWHSSEIIKRYTTTTMGPCQGALCAQHLSCFAKRKSSGEASSASARTTSRPPARAVRLEDLAGAVHEVIEKRTALHERHLKMGAKLDWSGSWKRPYNYGDPEDEYRAVRERVSLMDVSTLGKFLVAGVDAGALVDRVFPTRVDDLAVGRSRYMLALSEAGYAFDDGLICAVPEGFYVTSTSGGADGMEAWLRDWADRWGLHAHVVNQTAMLGAINVAGPRARDLLSKLCHDEIDGSAFPYMAHREIAVAGVPCRAVRVGFVGELSFELHHPRGKSVELWDALLKAGEEFDIKPHGLDALEILRLEKGHIYLAQDTLPDDHPAKLGMSWAVAAGKPSFIGRIGLERMAEFPLERKLVGLEFEGDATTLRGAPLYAGDRIVGRVTSCANSQALGRAIGLGWIRSIDGEFAGSLRAGATPAKVVPTPFYDPKGEKLRA